MEARPAPGVEQEKLLQNQENSIWHTTSDRAKNQKLGRFWSGCIHTIVLCFIS